MQEPTLGLALTFPDVISQIAVATDMDSRGQVLLGIASLVLQHVLSLL